MTSTKGLNNIILVEFFQQKAYKPYELIGLNNFRRKKQTIQREKGLKSASGRRFIKSLLI